MKRILQILTISIMMFFLSNCDKTPYYKFNQDAKDFFVFKKGSWWLYENDLTLERDCLYIEKSFFDLKMPSNNGYKSDLVLTSYNSKDSSFYGDATCFSNIGEKTFVRNYIIYHNNLISNYYEFPLAFTDTLFQKNRNDTIYIIDNKIFILDDKLHNEIKSFGYINNINISTFIREVVIERNIGLTRFHLKNDTSVISLRLVDYNIIK